MKTTTKVQAANQIIAELNSDIEKYRKELAARTEIAQNTVREQQPAPKREEVKDNFISSKIATYQQIENGVGADYNSLNNPNVRFSVKNMSIVSSLSNPNKYVRSSSVIPRYDSRLEALEHSENYRGVILDAKI